MRWAPAGFAVGSGLRVFAAALSAHLVARCAEVARDSELRDSLARNARRFFDEQLHPTSLAQRYLAAITKASGRSHPQAA